MESRNLFDQEKRRMMEHPTLMDDVPFTIAVRHSTALAQLIIRTTLSRNDLVVRKVNAQEKIPGVGYKGVVFDALCIDSCGNMYDVEIQKGHFENLPKRASFYEAMLTVHSLDAGSHGYADLPRRCVIFICDGDVEMSGKAMYSYSFKSDDGRQLEEGGRIIFVNGEYRSDDAIGRLMADMNQSDPERAFNEEVRSTLEVLMGEEGARDMSDEMEMLYNEAKTEGKVEGKTELAAMMLKEGRYSLEEILKMTGLSAEQVSEAAAKYAVK